jgi:hypothetical protein
MKYFCILTLFILSVNCLRSQTSNVASTIVQSATIEGMNSNYSIYTGIGVLELSVLGFQVRIFEHQFVGTKISTYLLSGKGGAEGGGSGIIWTYTTDDDRFINVYNAEFSYLFKMVHSNNPKNGIGAELSLGHKNYMRGFHFFWLVGFSGSTGPKIYDLYIPMFKIGIHYNF